MVSASATAIRSSSSPGGHSSPLGSVEFAATTTVGEPRLEISALNDGEQRIAALSDQRQQSLRGSSDLHAIGDSNAYLARTGERLMLTLEHRAASPPDPMEIELIVDEASGSSQLRVCDRAAAFASRERSLMDSVVEILEREERPMTRTALRAALQVNNARLGTALEQLSSDGRIERAGEGWALI